MAFTCGFFNSENGDRKYNAEQMSAIFDGIIADGVFTTIGDHMAVTAGTGMQVLVGTGKAWFDHTWNVNDAAYPLTIAASDVTLSRIDAIVLETNHSDSVRLNKLRVVQGTVASSPVKPTLTNSEKVHQHPLLMVNLHLFFQTHRQKVQLILNKYFYPHSNNLNDLNRTCHKQSGYS